MILKTELSNSVTQGVILKCHFCQRHSFGRRSAATVKSYQVSRFLPTVEITKYIFQRVQIIIFLHMVRKVIEECLE